MSMTSRERAFLIATVITILGTIGWYAIYAPYQQKKTTLIEECQDLVDQINRYRQKVAARSKVTQALMTARDRRRQTVDLFLASEKHSPALSANSLRTLLERIAGDITVEVNQVPTNAKDRTVGMRVKAKCTTAQIAEFLKRLEMSRPLLNIRSLYMSRIEPQHRRKNNVDITPEEPIQVQFNMEVLGYLSEEDS